MWDNGSMQGRNVKIQPWQLDRIAQANATNKELSIELGLGCKCISKYVKKLDITLPSGRVVNKWQLDRIAQADTTNKDLSSELGLNPDCITKHARLLGVTLPRGRRVALSLNVNHHALDDYSATTAYLVGYIMADGCIHNYKKANSKRLGFSVGHKDKQFLQQIMDLFGSKFIIRDRHRKTGVIESHVCLSSPRLYDKLVEMGVTERKSWGLIWPISVPDEMTPHLVRGFCDGDGYIGSHLRKGRKNRHLVITLVGTFAFLSGLQQVFNTVQGFTCGCLRRAVKNKPSFTLSYSYNSALAFAAWMYDQSTPQTRLDRKYQVYQDFLNTRNVL
jgi:hypothetical protein